MKVFKILHISDLHFDGCWLVQDRMKKRFCQSDPHVTNALQYCIRNKWLECLDAVLISGDLTCLGLDRDLNKAYEWVDDINKVLPTFLLPGNHDRYEFDVLGYPASIEFENVFHEYWEKNKKVQVFHLPSTSTPQLSVICCDFTLKQKTDSKHVLGHYGQGKVYPEELGDLENATKKEQDCGLPVLWMIHFSPEIRPRPTNLRDKLKKPLEILIDANIFLEKAEALGVKHILCGHTHKKDLFHPTGFDNIEVHCSGTSGCISKDHDTSIHFRNIFINNNSEIEKIIKEDFVWEDYRFIPF